MKAARAAGPASSQAVAHAPRRSSESGYIYFLALCMMVMAITASTVVLMDMRTERRRQREDEMIWRGKEFTRAIRLYYRRAGHYPQNLDELQKGIVNIQVIRPEVLKDPMNKDGDGKWRFIYTNQTGAIIGSVHYATMQQMAVLDLNGGKVPGVPGSDSDADNGSSSSSQSGQSQSEGSSSPAASNCTPAGASGIGSTGGIGSSTASGLQIGPGVGRNSMGAAQLPTQLPGASSQSGMGSSFSLGQNQGSSTGCPNGVPGAPPGMQLAAIQSLLQMKPTGPVDSPVVGGFLVGVGSTVDRASVKVYKTGKKYNEWEFIYNPLEEQAMAMQQGLNQAGTPGGAGPLGQPNGLGTPGATGGPVQAQPAEPQPQQPQPQQ